MKTQSDLVFRKDIFWGGLSWDEIYSCGNHNKGKSVLPSSDRTYANPELYSNPDLLRMTAEAVLGETKKELADLEQKILGYQSTQKQSLLRTAQRIAGGTFKGRVEVEGTLSSELGGDSDSRSKDILDQLTQAREEVGSTEYERRLRRAEVVAVNAGDKFRYTGLVMVAQGLSQMLDGDGDGTFIPEVIGKYFHCKYVSLIQ